jgi:hypothetical protein
MYQNVYYIYVTKDNEHWDVNGVYSDEESAESHKLSLLMLNTYKEVVIVPGPMKVYQD